VINVIRWLAALPVSIVALISIMVGAIASAAVADHKDRDHHTAGPNKIRLGPAQLYEALIASPVSRESV